MELPCYWITDPDIETPMGEAVVQYIDNTLLYLRDPNPSLHSALALIDMLGTFSSYWVNWNKSLVVALTPGPLPTVLFAPLLKVGI